MILKVSPESPPARKIEHAVEILRNGGVIIYPTDTFYGIGCDLFNKKAIERVYQIKKRSKKQPFSFICPDLKEISRYAIVSNFAYKTMRRLLPGPYTFILKGTKLVPKIMQTNRKMVGIRNPDHKVTLALVEALGNPIITTSAVAPSGQIFTDPELIAEQWGAQVDAVLDSGPQGFEASSVISLVNDSPEIIREGKGNVDFFMDEND